jgi:hypothetical protein
MRTLPSTLARETLATDELTKHENGKQNDNGDRENDPEPGRSRATPAFCAQA